MATTTQDIFDDLAALETPAKSPCGCNEASTELSTAGDLGSEVDSALQALAEGGEGDLTDLQFDESALETDLLFSEFDQESQAKLDDLISLAERYPGLKITISF